MYVSNKQSSRASRFRLVRLFGSAAITVAMVACGTAGDDSSHAESEGGSGSTVGGGYMALGGSAGDGLALTGGSAGRSTEGAGTPGSGNAGSGSTHWFCGPVNEACVCTTSATDSGSCEQQPEATCCFTNVSDLGTFCSCYPPSNSVCNLRGDPGYPAVASCPPETIPVREAIPASASGGAGGGMRSGSGGAPVKQESCTGVAPACGNQSSSFSCDGIAGCEWSGCTGSPGGCSSHSDPSTCRDIEGCLWSGSEPFKYCSGTARSCSSYSSSSSCEGQGSCNWEGCKGVPTACSVLRSRATCNDQPGCSWE